MGVAVDANLAAPVVDRKVVPSRVLWAPLLLFLMTFLVVNFATLSRMPFVWLDEVYFADPAINLVNGEGFISRAWDHSPETRTVSSTSPLYSLALAGWIKVFGVHPLTVRSLGLFFVCVGLLVLYSACLRWVSSLSPGWLLGMCLVIALTYGFAFSYRSGRPESLLFLIWTLLFHAASWSHPLSRVLAVFFLAFLMPFVGQVACIALGILTCILVILSPRRWLGLAATVITGMAVGTLCFIAAYKGMGIWADFQVAVNKQGGNPLMRLLHRLTSNPLSQHSNAIPKDFSLVPLMIGLGWMALLEWRRKSLHWNSLLSFGALYAIILPFALYLLGKFPTYYAWMLTVPLVVGLCILYGQEELKVKRRLWFPRGILVASCLAGFPLQLAFAMPDWRDRAYGPVEEWTKQVLKPGDIALVDYPFYYAARANAGKVYLYGYAEQLRPEDIESLNVLILSPHKTYGMTRQELMQKLGSDWAPTGEMRRDRGSLGGNDWQLGFLSLPNYDGEVYRRLKAAPRASADIIQ